MEQNTPKKDTNNKTLAKSHLTSDSKGGATEPNLLSPKSKKKNLYLTRLEEHKKTHEERMVKLIEKTKAEEDKKYSDVPKINKKGVDKYLKTTGSFLERLKEQNEKQKERKEKLINSIEEQRKKEEEEIFKKVNEINKRKLTKEEWNQQVEKMKEVEKKKKERCNKIAEEAKKEEMRECKFRPTIDDGSEEIVKKTFGHTRMNSAATIKRLYNKDLEKRKEKKEYLDTLYTPTFTPDTNKGKKSHTSSTSLKRSTDFSLSDKKK